MNIVMLKLEYSDHLTWRADSLEKTLMLGKIWGQEEKGATEDEMVNDIADSMDISMNKPWEMVKDREAWYAAVYAVAKSWTQPSDWKTTGIPSEAFLFRTNIPGTRMFQISLTGTPDANLPPRKDRNSGWHMDFLFHNNLHKSHFSCLSWKVLTSKKAESESCVHFPQQLAECMKQSEQLKTFMTLAGEGNGYPFQYSCLKNPMDRGAERVIVHGIAKNQIRLKQLSTHTRPIAYTCICFICFLNHCINITQHPSPRSSPNKSSNSKGTDATTQLLWTTQHLRKINCWEKAEERWRRNKNRLMNDSTYWVILAYSNQKRTDHSEQRC